MTGFTPKTPSLMQDTRRLLAGLEHRASKGLGQHFLIDAGVLAKICRAACLSAGDTVIEVGPGLGVLTRELVSGAGRVIAVELDRRLAEALPGTLGNVPNLCVVHGDILKMDVASLLAEGGQSAPRSYKVVANLPYYITSAILRFFLEAVPPPEVMVVMVQREVAKTITAKPGRMSLLALSVQVYGRPQIVSRVPAGCFHPVPAVDSAVLKVCPHEAPLITPGERESFFRLARAGFCAARKQLPNSLAQGLGMDKAAARNLLAEAGIDPRRRAETLSVEEWLKLWRGYVRMDE